MPRVLLYVAGLPAGIDLCHDAGGVNLGSGGLSELFPFVFGCGREELCGVGIQLLQNLVQATPGDGAYILEENEQGESSFGEVAAESSRCFL